MENPNMFERDSFIGNVKKLISYPFMDDNKKLVFKTDKLIKKYGKKKKK